MRYHAAGRCTGLSRDLVEKLLSRGPCIGAFGSLLHAVPQLLDRLFVSFNTRQGLRKYAVCASHVCCCLAGRRGAAHTHTYGQCVLVDTCSVCVCGALPWSDSELQWCSMVVRVRLCVCQFFRGGIRPPCLVVEVCLVLNGACSRAPTVVPGHQSVAPVGSHLHARGCKHLRLQPATHCAAWHVASPDLCLLRSGVCGARSISATRDSACVLCTGGFAVAVLFVRPLVPVRGVVALFDLFVGGCCGAGLSATALGHAAAACLLPAVCLERTHSRCQERTVTLLRCFPPAGAPCALLLPCAVQRCCCAGRGSIRASEVSVVPRATLLFDRSFVGCSR